MKYYPHFTIGSAIPSSLLIVISIILVLFSKTEENPTDYKIASAVFAGVSMLIGFIPLTVQFVTCCRRKPDSLKITVPSGLVLTLTSVLALLFYVGGVIMIFIPNEESMGYIVGYIVLIAIALILIYVPGFIIYIILFILHKKLITKHEVKNVNETPIFEPQVEEQEVLYE